MSELAQRQMAALKARGRTEQVTYRPNGGEAREITALVDREGGQEVMHAAAPAIRVTVVNDSAAGVTPAEIDVGADTIDVAERYAGTPASRHLQRIAGQDGDFVIVELQ